MIETETTESPNKSSQLSKMTGTKPSPDMFKMRAGKTSIEIVSPQDKTELWAEPKTTTRATGKIHTIEKDPGLNQSLNPPNNDPSNRNVGTTRITETSTNIKITSLIEFPNSLNRFKTTFMLDTEQT
jgi:hypothetical protein